MERKSMYFSILYCVTARFLLWDMSKFLGMLTNVLPVILFEFTMPAWKRYN